MATIDPRSEEGARIGLDRYCSSLEARIAELEAALQKIASIKAAVEIMTPDKERGDEYCHKLDLVRWMARQALGQK